MSCDDLCTTCTDLPTSYHDLVTNDKSFVRVSYDQGIALLEGEETLIFCTIGATLLARRRRRKRRPGHAKEVLGKTMVVEDKSGGTGGGGGRGHFHLHLPPPPFLTPKKCPFSKSFFRVHHPWTESYVWPCSCTVESLLISSCQIFQAAFIFKKWAFQQVLRGLLWVSAFTGCICCISIAPFTQVGFCCGQYPCGVCWGTSTASTQIYGQVLVVHWLGLAALLDVALQCVVPPTMLALLFEEAETVAGLHEWISSSISGGLGLVGGYDKDGERHHLASCVQSCWLLSCERQVERFQPGHVGCQHS